VAVSDELLSKNPVPFVVHKLFPVMLEVAIKMMLSFEKMF
jgi:hypothetical protein